MDYSKLFEKIDKCEASSVRARLKSEDISSVSAFEVKNQTGSLFFVKQKMKSSAANLNGENYTYRITYDIVNEEGEVLAWINAYTRLISAKEVEIEYAVSSEMQGKGIATAMLAVMTEDIYKSQIFDGLAVLKNGDEVRKKLQIENLLLSINNDNYASKKVAEKCGYKSDNEGGFNMTRDKYFEQNGYQP